MRTEFDAEMDAIEGEYRRIQQSDANFAIGCWIAGLVCLALAFWLS